jgi:outer membrane lipoprotein carrier protein
MDINSAVGKSVDIVVYRIANFSDDDVFYRIAYGSSKKIVEYIQILVYSIVIPAFYRPIRRGLFTIKKACQPVHLGIIFPHDMEQPMRNSFASLVFLLFIFFAAPAWGADLLSLDEVVQKIQDTYEQTGQVKAHFTQALTLKAMQKTQLEEGTFYFKKPKRMRWVYTKPAAKELVINPEKAWLYVPADKIAYVQDAESLFKSTVSVRFLAGIGKLKDDFRISFAGDKKVDKAGNYLLDLVPVKPEEGVKKLQVAVNRESFQIVKVVLFDPYGNVTTLAFSGLELNRDLPDSLFTFKPPAGVDVMKQ